MHPGERVDVPYAGGVEDDGGGAAVLVPGEARAGQDGGEAEVRLAGGEVEQAPVEGVAPEFRGLRQAQPAGEETAGRGAGEAEIAVGHVCLPGG